MSEFKECVMALDFHDGPGDGWIQVNVRLPRAHARVLVSAAFDGPDVRVATGAGCWMPACTDFPNGQWWATSAWGFQQVEQIPIEVTHWAPWPESP